MKSPTLKTNNYTLRPFDKKDCLLWQQWDIDPEVQAHMPEPKNEPMDIKKQYEYIEECEADEDGYYWSIDADDKVTIGTVALFEIDKHHQSTQISIVVGDKNYWGRGVATEVLKEVCRHATEDLNLKYISAEVEYDNIPMRKVFDKIGFTQDGLFKKARVKNGERIDVIYFGFGK